MSNNNENEEDIKVILVGEPGTGKTCLINVSVGGKFMEISNSTLLSTFVPKEFMKKGKKYILNIWDTAGQEKFRAMTKIFIKDSKIVIFVYAINSSNSFDGLKTYWIDAIKDALGDEPILGIVGNKCDLFMEEQIKEDEVKSYARELGIKFKLVSAKEDPNGFISFLEELLEDFLKKKGIEIRRESIAITRQDNQVENKKKSGCCK